MNFVIECDVGRRNTCQVCHLMCLLPDLRPEVTDPFFGPTAYRSIQRSKIFTPIALQMTSSGVTKFSKTQLFPEYYKLYSRSESFTVLAVKAD
jgi:hypothetical protein